MLVYLVTNLINGKRYVGQTSYSLEKRWFLHCNRKSCKALHGAIKKYGPNSFSIETIFEVPTKELAGELEIESIKNLNSKYPNGYNLTDGGEGVRSLPDEIRLKRNRALLGNKNAVGAIRTPAYCRQKSESQIGRKFSDETKQRMSESAKRKPPISEETRKKLSETRKRLGTRPPVRSSEEAALAGRISGHKRYHVARGIINPNCSLCKGKDASPPASCS